jgi:hypothetical protein
MNLLRPVKNWIFREPAATSPWLEGLKITQADIDSALFHPEMESSPAMPCPVMAITWCEEDIRA